MSKKNYLFLLITTLVFLTPFTSFGQKQGLITAEELTSNPGKYVVIAVSGEDDFENTHIPGAERISRSDFTISNDDFGGLMAGKDQIEALLSSLYIKDNDKIVVYDYKGGCDAIRAKLIFDHYGHPETYLLDGGMHYWNSPNDSLFMRIITDTVPYVFPENKVSSGHVMLEEVKKALDDPNTILVDTRSHEEYTGEKQKDGAFRAGHIPGAINIDWASNIDYKGDSTILPLEKLTELYVSHGITSDKNIICYCHSGVRSSHTTYVLTQIMGYENVKNYDGSWIEWSFNRNLPLDTGFVTPQALIDYAERQESYTNVFFNSFKSFANYTWAEITFQVTPWYINYFWWLIVLSLVVWALELIFPWRKNQPAFRKDFWMDAFFMFFNFYIFKLIIFMAFSNLTAKFFHDVTGSNSSSFALFDMSSFPLWAQLIIFFIATDFVQWFTHVILHRYNFFWRFHKVHHSVEQMGFAAHLRYHWMENVFYTPMKYIMVMLIGGFTPEMAYIVFYIAIAIGHLNHANISLSYGPLKYIINNPKMHIWHHAKELPKDRQFGVNFGISLSIWDYIFRTNYIPSSGRDIPLGFAGMEKYPKKFFGLLFSGFGKTPDEK